MEAMLIHIQHDKQFRHRTPTYNEALGLVLDSFFDNFIFIKNGKHK